MQMHVVPADVQRLAGTMTLGTPVRQFGRGWLVPVIVSVDSSSTIVPASWSLQVRATGTAQIASMMLRRSGAAVAITPVFETTRQSGQTASYVVSFDDAAAKTFFARGSAIVAELEIVSGTGRVDLALDPTLTLLSDGGGMTKATAGLGTLSLAGVTADDGGVSSLPRRHAVH